MQGEAPRGFARGESPVCKVLLRNGDHTLETYAILDDGSERTILLQEAVQRLHLQGTPESLTLRTVRQDQCLFVSTTSPAAELFKQVEKLWQLETLPYRNEKLLTRSRRDQEAMNLLEAKTRRVEVDGVLRYATPLLRHREKRLGRDPVKAEAYQAEIMKLKKAGYVSRISHEQVKTSKESWFIPHHLVTHNGKNRIVFNCSYTYRDKNLNELLLSGPNLGASLLGVLLRFREHSIAVSSDIKGMFHQVRLLPEDRSLLRFLWRDLQKDQPSVYEWQVLPFGTTCSPCCAIYALQRHVHDHTHPGDAVRESIENHFYVDNWLQSFPTPDRAQDVADKLRGLLLEGGFELRQWASSMPDVIGHLPKEIRSESSEQLLNHTDMDPQEPALGLRWSCHSDTLRYKSRLLEHSPATMRTIYKGRNRVQSAS
ncbi:hypothetical protein L3Q82_024436, partial [Scortum barcoo]